MEPCVPSCWLSHPPTYPACNILTGGPWIFELLPRSPRSALLPFLFWGRVAPTKIDKTVGHPWGLVSAINLIWGLVSAINRRALVFVSWVFALGKNSRNGFRKAWGKQPTGSRAPKLCSQDGGAG